MNIRTDPEARIAIRPAEAKDAGEYLQLVDALARYERQPPPDAAAKVRLIDHLFGKRPYYRLLVAEDENTSHLVGYAAWFLSYSTFAAMPTFYLEDLFVLAEYRRSQVGGRLLQTCARTAIAEGCGRMDFLVLDWNEMALKFYKKHGIEPNQDWILHRVDAEGIRRLSGEI